jgi:hypothetical protein
VTKEKAIDALSSAKSVTRVAENASREELLVLVKGLAAVADMARNGCYGAYAKLAYALTPEARSAVIDAAQLVNQAGKGM